MKKRILMLGFTCGEFGSELLQIFEKQDLVPVEDTFACHLTAQALTALRIEELAALVRLHNCEAVMTLPTTNFIGQIVKHGLDGNIAVYGLSTKDVNNEDIPEDILQRVNHQNAVRAMQTSFGSIPQMHPSGLVMVAMGGPQQGYPGGFPHTDYSQASSTVTMLDMVQIGSFNA